MGAETMLTADTTSSLHFDHATHTYFEGRIVRPSVTQVLRAEGFLNWLDEIPAHILERKRRLGTLVHQASALLDEGKNLEEYNIPGEVFEWLVGYQNFKNDSYFAPALIEHRMVGDAYGMRYGMTLDRSGMYDGEEYILELKCGAAEDPVWGLQLAAYDLGLLNHESRPRPRAKRAALQLGPSFNRGYKLHPYPDPADYHIWMNSLANTIWKQNHSCFKPAALPERLN